MFTTLSIEQVLSYQPPSKPQFNGYMADIPQTLPLLPSPAPCPLYQPPPISHRARQAQVAPNLACVRVFGLHCEPGDDAWYRRGIRMLMLLQTIITSVQQHQWQSERAETKALQHLVAFPPNLKISNFIGSCILSPTVIWYMMYHDSVCFKLQLTCYVEQQWWLLECEGTGLQSPDSSLALDHTLHIDTRSHTVTHTLYTITRVTHTIHLVLL